MACSPNRRAALQMLQSLADEQRLCYGLLGLEPLSRGRACFRSALGRCAGACCGKESVEAHRDRLLAQMSKLQLVCWPWAGPVALEERGPDMTQYHVIHNWLWLGRRRLARPGRGADPSARRIRPGWLQDPL
ncbi:excinuclease cho (excinuclease ABC alternative C subunit) [Klebsiella variicola]|uniref:Excinuclease cho (Excinuclease ABC alternative C subunit) n=1 Tax=Klebsiella variicola TaxID=244366 RepID=A0A7H4MI59_KLEVA|nr:excinuclease cho (excinuclease ABC alternative C subunit) [Klebsiella variicola]